MDKILLAGGDREEVKSDEKAGKEVGGGGAGRSHVLTKHWRKGMAGPYGMEE